MFLTLLHSAVLSLSLFFLMFSSTPSFDASMLSSILVSPFSFFFSDTVICLVAFVHWYKFSCPLVDLSEFLLCLFMNGPEHQTRGTPDVFIPLMRFLLQSLVSWSFLVRLGTFFLFCSFPLVFLCPLLLFPSTCNFPSLQIFCLLSRFGFCIPSVVSLSDFTLAEWYIFIGPTPSLCPSCIFLWFVSRCFILFHFW